jgi:hypothetical protein
MHLKQPYPHMYTHRLHFQPYPHMFTHRLHFGPRVAHWPEATYACIVRAPVPPPHTHFPAPPHTLPSPTSHLSCLMYSASAVASLKRQAWGIRQALCSLPAPHYECVSMMLACREAGRWTQADDVKRSSVCRTMVHSARTPMTRPLPRPAAIASRHATSRAMQVTYALLVSQAAPAALFSTQPMSLSLVDIQAHMQGSTLPDP